MAPVKTDEQLETDRRNAQLLEDLRAARALIASRDCWTTGAGARDANGDAINVSEFDDARSWCMMGASFTVTHRYGSGASRRHTAVTSALQKAVLALGAENQGGGTIAHFNDHRGHAAVLRAFDTAIALREELV